MVVETSKGSIKVKSNDDDWTFFALKVIGLTIVDSYGDKNLTKLRPSGFLFMKIMLSGTLVINNQPSQNKPPKYEHKFLDDKQKPRWKFIE